MNVLNMLNKCKNDRQLYKYIQYRLEKCIQLGEEANEGFKFIGDDVDINPNIPLMNIEDGYDINIYWNGFIPPDVKVVYGVMYPLACHGGYYYYMDDFDYIIEFVEYIRGKKLFKESDLIAYVHQFLRDYFVKPLEPNRREFYFNLLCDSNGMFYPPSKERSIGDFKGHNLARCTEFGAVGQNLLAFMGLDTIYVHDKAHAYNIVSFENEQPAIVDFSKGVILENLLDKSKKILPFIADLDEKPEDFIEKILTSYYRVEFNEYKVYSLGRMYFQQTFSKKRSYGSAGISPEENSILINGEVDDSLEHKELILSDSSKESPNARKLILK